MASSLWTPILQCSFLYPNKETTLSTPSSVTVSWLEMHAFVLAIEGQPFRFFTALLSSPIWFPLCSSMIVIIHFPYAGHLSMDSKVAQKQHSEVSMEEWKQSCSPGDDLDFRSNGDATMTAAFMAIPPLSPPPLPLPPPPPFISRSVFTHTFFSLSFYLSAPLLMLTSFIPC